MPDRHNFVLSAIAFLLELLLAGHGIPFEDIDRDLTESGLKLKKKVPKSTAVEQSEKERSNQRFIMVLAELLNRERPIKKKD